MVLLGLRQSQVTFVLVMKNTFYFTLKTFRSQDISVFVMTFWSCIKKDSIRKIRLISKFMTSQPG